MCVCVNIKFLRSDCARTNIEKNNLLLCKCIFSDDIFSYVDAYSLKH